LDHYDASTGWQPLFIVAGIGLIVIACGVAVQVWQIIASIRDRNHNRDTTGDPWNGRTLEWATSSPPPFYNFAVIPHVHGRDAFWDMKNSGKATESPEYEDIELPKNTAMGIYVSGFTFLIGFAFVWHINWLAIAGLVGAITCVIIRSLDEHTEYVIRASEIARMEAGGK